MGAPRHGKNALVFINGSELTGANSWSINITPDSVETTEFGDEWKGRVVGMNDWSGDLNAFDHDDDKILQTAATAGASMPLEIIPDATSTEDNYSGNAIFGFGSSGSTTAAIANSSSFVGAGELSINGFAS